MKIVQLVTGLVGRYAEQWAGLFFLWTVATVACASEPSMAISTPSALARQADGLLVKFKAHVSEQQVHSISEKYGAFEVHTLASPRQVIPDTLMAQWRHLKFSSDSDLQQIMQHMAQDTDVETVELNGVVTIQKQQ